jgi:hypothetical protein
MEISTESSRGIYPIFKNMFEVYIFVQGIPIGDKVMRGKEPLAE